MTLLWKACAIVALATLSATDAQTDHFSGDLITTRWERFTNPVGPGNGAFLSPREDVLVVVSSDTTVRALNPETGAPLWSFAPTIGSTTSGGVFFSTADAVTYAAYCVTTGVSSTILAIDIASGNPLFSTGTIQGECIGTPVTTADGRYVLINHNVGGAVGFFSLFDVTTPGTAVYSYSAQDFDAPFGAIGYFWNPGAGYFEGGESNTNDVFIWGLDQSPTINETIGQVFAFQLPIPPAPFNVTLVGGERDFVSPLPPIITNDGFSMYWAVSRSQQRVWIGTPGRGRNDFSTNGVNTVGFMRGEPRGKASAAPPTISNDPLAPFVSGPSAGNEIFRLSADFIEDESAPTFMTTVPVTSRVVISRDDARIYFGTPIPDGNLVGLTSDTLTQVWNISIPNGVSGEMALSLNGDTLFVADALGGVRAFEVADAPEITLAPTPSPANRTAAPVIGTFSPAPAGPNVTQPVTPPPVAVFVTPSPVALVAPTAESLAPSTTAPSTANAGAATEAPTIAGGFESDIPSLTPNGSFKPSAGMDDVGSEPAPEGETDEDSDEDSPTTKAPVSAPRGTMSGAVTIAGTSVISLAIAGFIAVAV